MTSGRGKLDGIGGEVGQHLLDALLVEGDGWQVRLTVTAQADIFSRRGRGQHFHHAFHQRRQRRRSEFEAHFPGLQPRHVQQVVDIEPQLVATLLGDAQVFQLGFIHGTGQAVDENGNELAGRGERRLQFVGEGVVEVLDLGIALHQVRIHALHLRPGEAQLLFVVFALGDVAADDQHIGNAAGTIADDTALRLDVMHGPVGGEQAIIRALADSRADGFRENAADALLVFGVDLQKGISASLQIRIGHQGAVAGVVIEAPALEIQDGDEVSHIFRDLTKPLFAVVQFGFGFFALGDVADVALDHAEVVHLIDVADELHVDPASIGGFQRLVFVANVLLLL